MMMWMRGINPWSVLLLGLGLTACDDTSLVGAQSPAGATGTSPVGGAGTGAPPVVDWPAEGLVSSSSGRSGPWLFFDSRRGTNRDIYAIQPDGSSIERMTTSASIEREPAVSPDGKTLAFASDRSGSFQLYLMPLPGGVVHQLTRRSGADQPAWSPDGTQIAFHAHTAIYVIGADGQGERQVAQAPYNVDGIEPFHPMFVSDRRLLYDTYHRIYSLDLDTGVAAQLAEQTGYLQHPSLSPDGHLIAYSAMCEEAVNSVWLIPLASFESGCGVGTRVTAEGDFARFPSISPTGLIAFERAAPSTVLGGLPATAHIGLADGGLRVADLTHGEGDDRNPTWSPASLVLP